MAYNSYNERKRRSIYSGSCRSSYRTSRPRQQYQKLGYNSDWESQQTSIEEGKYRRGRLTISQLNVPEIHREKGNKSINQSPCSYNINKLKPNAATVLTETPNIKKTPTCSLTVTPFGPDVYQCHRMSYDVYSSVKRMNNVFSSNKSSLASSKDNSNIFGENNSIVMPDIDIWKDYTTELSPALPKAKFDRNHLRTPNKQKIKANMTYWSKRKSSFDRNNKNILKILKENEDVKQKEMTENKPRYDKKLLKFRMSHRGGKLLQI